MKLLQALLLGLLCASAALASAPVQRPGMKPTQCAVCHGKDPVLPAGHPDVAKAKPGACAECHAKTGATSLRGKLPLGHRHALAGVECAACHGKGKPAGRPAPSVCVSCHEMTALVASTKDALEQNPHEDKHGYSANCNLCHHQHKKAANYCLTCHAFNWPVP